MEIALWIATALFASVALGTGIFKLVRSKEKLVAMQPWAGDFTSLQLKAIGAAELLGAFGVVLPQLTGILPALTSIAAFALVALQAGAIATHLRRKESVIPNVVVMALGLVVGIGWLVFGATPHNDAGVGAAIKAQLSPFEKDGSTTVDIGDVIGGDWTQLVIVCRGVTEQDVTRALGFARDVGPSVDGAGFGSLMIFTDGSEIESYFTDDDEDEWYFSPCPALGLDDSEPVESALVMPRDASTLDFYFEDSQAPYSHWHVPREYFDGLLEEQR